MSWLRYIKIEIHSPCFAIKLPWPEALVPMAEAVHDQTNRLPTQQTEERQISIQDKKNLCCPPSLESSERLRTQHYHRVVVKFGDVEEAWRWKWHGILRICWRTLLASCDWVFGKVGCIQMETLGEIWLPNGEEGGVGRWVVKVEVLPGLKQVEQMLQFLRKEKRVENEIRSLFKNR